MDPEDVNATGQPDVPPESTEETQAEAVNQDSSSREGEERQPLSVEDAFTQARARLAEDRTQEGEDENGEQSASQPGENAADSKTEEEQEPEPEPTLTAQQQLDRINQLVKLGRESELSAQERGVLNRIRMEAREQIRQEAEQEDQFRELYVGLLAQEAEDPVEFAKMLQGERGEQLLRFKKMYAQAHPDVTLDSPHTPVVKREEVRQQAFVEAFDTVDAAIGLAASKYGITEAAIEEVYTASQGDFSAYLDGIVAAAVKAEIERERPKIAKAEREAHKLELQAARANKTIVTPAPLNGSAASKAPATVNHGVFKDAFAAAADTARRLAEA